MWKDLILWHEKGENRFFPFVGRMCTECGKKRMRYFSMITC